MPLFRKKEKLPELPPIELPSYEPILEKKEEKPETKPEEKPAAEELEIPVRKKIEKPERKEPEPETREFEIEKKEGPLFVRIDKYKEALHSLEYIKNRIKEAEHVLDEIDRLRMEEARELEHWKNELKAIKDKLLGIDKKLFEV